MAAAQKELFLILNQLKPFYLKAQVGKFGKGSYFRNCLRASFAKAYELMLRFENAKPEDAFFMIASLRGICEDVILLKYISTKRKDLREEFILDFISLEVMENLETQSQFFGVLRPHQPVLTAGIDSNAAKAKIIPKMQAFWAPDFNISGNKTFPQIRQIAAKVQMECVYEYIYKLTCDLVHFNPNILLRAGWGLLATPTFSFANFSGYYTMFAYVYGTLLLLLNLEVIDAELRPNNRNKDIRVMLFDWLLQLERWPEIVTFEEMNLPRPKSSPTFRIIHSAAMRASHTSILDVLQSASKVSPGQPQTQRFAAVQDAMEFFEEAVRRDEKTRKALKLRSKRKKRITT